MFASDLHNPQPFLITRSYYAHRLDKNALIPLPFHSLPEFRFLSVIHDEPITTTGALGGSVGPRCQLPDSANWTSVATDTDNFQVWAGASSPIFNITRPRNLGSTCGSAGSRHRVRDVPESILAVIALRSLRTKLHAEDSSPSVSLVTLSAYQLLVADDLPFRSMAKRPTATSVSLSSWAKALVDLSLSSTRAGALVSSCHQCPPYQMEKQTKQQITTTENHTLMQVWHWRVQHHVIPACASIHH
jgi:hypothetical protein